MEPIGYVIICKEELKEQSLAVPLILTLEAAQKEVKRIEGTPGQTMRCFEDHFIVQIYSRDPLSQTWETTYG